MYPCPQRYIAANFDLHCFLLVLIKNTTWQENRQVVFLGEIVAIPLRGSSGFRRLNFFFQLALLFDQGITSSAVRQKLD